MLKKNEYLNKRKAHWEREYKMRRSETGMGKNYRRLLVRAYRYLIGECSSVLEIGCGRGDLLAAVAPAGSVGVDFSPAAVEQAMDRHPEYVFVCCEATEYIPPKSFDVIILSDLLNDTWDVQELLALVHGWCAPRTRIIINSYSRVWQPAISLARRMRWTASSLPQNWLTRDDVINLMHLEGMEPVALREEILWPFNTPVLQTFCNRYLARIWPFSLLALSNFVVGRAPRPEVTPDSTVSIVVAARNEEGNIPEIFDAVPELGGGSELIFVEGGSKDDTYNVIQREIAARDSCNAKLFKQDGRGKGDAVRKGFANATGDVLMILDADLTVPPGDLRRFFKVLAEGRAEYVNGVRLVYPMEDQAMRFFNFLGNKFFSLAFSWLLGRPIKDTLCGTKVMTRRNYEAIAANRSYFGEFDPFGDFDLIFGAAKLNLKFVDLPVRYRQRKYGDTNISRWRHGWLLLKMAAFALRKIKFV